MTQSAEDNLHIDRPYRREPVFQHKNVRVFRTHRGMTLEVQTIINNMRERDRHEYEAVGGNPQSDVWDMLRASADAFVVWRDDRPIFSFGYVNSYSHVGLVWGFGTDEATKVIPAITKFGREVWLPELFANGIRRLEVRVPATCNSSVSWLMYNFGARCECADMEGISLSDEPYWQVALTPRLFQRKLDVQSKSTKAAKADSSTSEVV